MHTQSIFRSCVRGVALLCSLAPFLFARLFLLSVLSHSAYAARDLATDDKEKSLEKVLKEAAFFFSYIGLSYYMLPFVSFECTEDWKTVVYDCFTPFSLWLDSVRCICVLGINLLFIKDIMDRIDLITTEFVGLVAMFMSIYHYITMKLLETNQTPGNPQMTRVKAKAHVTCMVTVYLIVTAGVLLELDKKVCLADKWSNNEAKMAFAYGTVTILTAVAMACEIAHIVTAVLHRIHKNFWDDDVRPIFLTKLAAAAMTLLSDGFDTVRYFTVKRYWKQGYFTRCALIVSTVTTACSLVLVISRLIGPRRQKKAIDFAMNAIKEATDSVCANLVEITESVHAWCNDFKIHISNRCSQVLERLVAM